MQAKLDSAPFPDSVAYLWEWVVALHGRSGVGMGGAAPLSYSTVEAWAKLTGHRPLPYEVEALMVLDAAMMSKGDVATSDEADEPEQVVTPAWPAKKTDG